MTAEQLMATLEADSEFTERQILADARFRQQGELLRQAEAPLIKDLSAAGAANLESVWDLVNTRKSYRKLVPVLLAHLDRDYPSRIREGIARALAVPEARVGWEQLVNSYVSEPSFGGNGQVNDVKWALHLAIAAAADETVVDDLVALTVNRRNREYRSFFIDALARINTQHSRAALDELKTDASLKEAFARVSSVSRPRR